MSTPFHFRKIPTQVRGKLLFLPMYTRGFALLLKQSCDDHGRIELDGKHPAEAIARLCAATPNERRRIAGDLDELIRVGYLRYDPDALVVVEQEQDWEQIDSSRGPGARSSRPHRAVGSTPRPHPYNVAPTSQNHRPYSSQRNHSADFDRREEKRREEEKKKEETRPEGVQGELAPRTDPTPTLRKQELEQVVGKGPASWGMDGSGAYQSDSAKALTPPNPTRAVPAPHVDRQAPFVPVVDPKPVRTSKAPSSGSPDTPATLVELGTPTASKVKPGQRAKGGKRAADDEGDPLPEDWTVKDHHYAYGREKLGAQKKHVDYWADDMRDTAMSRGWRSKDWDAKFRTFMRKAMEFSKGVLPNVPDPLPPAEVNRPVPPPPPRHPMVEEGAQRARERLEGPNPPNLMELFRDACNPNKYFTNSEPA